MSLQTLRSSPDVGYARITRRLEALRGSQVRRAFTAKAQEDRLSAASAANAYAVASEIVERERQAGLNRLVRSVALRRGERIVNGERLYSAAWLSDPELVSWNSASKASGA